MKALRRSLLVVTLLWALPWLALVSAAEESGSGGASQGTPLISLRSGPWSDASVWSRGKAPAEGDSVVISRGTAIVYDVSSTANIARLEVAGSLTFSRSTSTNLDVGLFQVSPGGYLELGTEQDPLPRTVTARVRLINPGNGDNGLVSGGEVQLHGAPLQYVYTRLAGSAARGSAIITVQDPVDWKAGDHVVIASTTRNAFESEENDVIRVDGRALVLMRPLRFAHSGEEPTRAEVANLSRNVIITSKDPAGRGFTTFLPGSKAAVGYAEFNTLGVQAHGKYPIHFHVAGDSMRGSYVKGASIWNSNNRFIAVHSSSYINLSYNVGFNALGHGYFITDEADAVFNTFDHNLGILTRPGTLLESDAAPAVFWIPNPVNTFTNNIAVSAGGNGFDYKLPPIRVDIPPLGGKVLVRSLAVLKFENNTAHSNNGHGIRTYVLNGAGSKNESVLTGARVWRNNNAGVSITGNRVTLQGAELFGNRKANLFLMGNDNSVRDSTVRGELAAAPADSSLGPTARGIVVRGRNVAVSGSILEGHVAPESQVGSDIGLFQDEEGATTLTVRDTLLKSSRPIIFGYPLNGLTTIKVENYQREQGNSFNLYRIDASTPLSCEPSTVDQGYVAKKCALAPAS